MHWSHILPGAPLRPIGTNFGLRLRIVDVINCAKFYRKVFGFCEGSKFDHSHWIAMSPLTLLGTNVPAVRQTKTLLNGFSCDNET